MPKGTGEAQEIKRSKTFNEVNTTVVEDILDIPQNKSAFMKKGPDLLNKKTSAKKQVTAKDLKKKAETIPVKVPKKKKKEEERNAAKAEILRLHKELEAEEGAHLSGENIDRNYLAALSESDIDKRAKEAVKREKNALGIEEYERNHRPGNRADYVHIDKETLKAKLSLFKKMRSEPYDMSTDDKFLENLDKNYMLCEAADHIRYWLKEASDGGFLPEGEDMPALQEKIALFAEVRKYIDTQKSLMKNPYYKYMAKDDISYTDNQMQRLHDKTTNQNLKSYLADMRTLKSLRFVRRKGMKSIASFAKEEGRRQTEILRTRGEKQDIINRLSDKTMSFTANRRFADADYDARFTPKLFNETLARFKAMDIRSLRFGSIREIVDHYDENQYIFDQMHDFEHLLFVAVQRGLAPSDEELIEFRAKIEALTRAEIMVSNIQLKILKNPDNFLDNQSYRELADSAYNDVSNSADKADRDLPPKVGCDLGKYLKTIVKRYKNEHKDREKTITVMYGLSHPQKDKDKNIVPGIIPQKELEKRMASYQKNAVNVQYMRNLRTNLDTIFGRKQICVAEVYARRTGKKPYTQFGRTLTPYLCGKTPKEIIRVIDIMQSGSAEDKEKLYTEISLDAFKSDVTGYDTKDPKLFFRNAASRFRVENILNNLGGSSGEAQYYVRDPKIRKKIEVFFSAGTGNAYSCAFNQAAVSRYMEAVEYEDWFANPSDVNELVTEIDNASDEEEDKTITIEGEDHIIRAGSFQLLAKAMKRFDFMVNCGKSMHNMERNARGIRDSASVAYYDEMKAQGLVSEVTKDECRKLAGFYDNYTKSYDASHRTLMDEVIEEIKNEDPGFTFKAGTRTRIISHMAALNKDKDKDELKKSVSLFKGLIINEKKTDAASKQERARAIEEMFGTIMSFDISRMNFASYMDLIASKKEDPERFEDCYAVTNLAADAVNYISVYKKLREDEEVRTLLNDAHVEEIKSRMELLMSAYQFFSVDFLKAVSSDQIEKTGKSFDDIMHLNQSEIEENLMAAQTTGDPELANFWITIKSLTEPLDGYDIGVPLTVIEERVRAEHGLYGRSRALEARNILNGSKSVLEGAASGELAYEVKSESAFRQGYTGNFKEKKYTVSEREGKLYNKDSRLFVKRNAYEDLTKKSRTVLDSMVRSKRGISLKNRIAAGEEDLASLCAFMGDKAKENDSLAAEYGDKKTRFEVMDRLTKSLMEMNINIKADSDEEFAAEAAKMELISQRAKAYKALLEKNPEYEKRLENRLPGSRLSDLEKVNRRIDCMLAISDYYRARKALMSDSYYILHYNDEISANRDSATNDDQRRVADLINLVALCTRRLARSEYRTREDADIERVLANAEDQSRRSAFLTARPDISKADPGTVHEHNEEIIRYMQAAGLTVYGAKDKIMKSDDNNPAPQAIKHRTQAVINYLDAVKTCARHDYSTKYKDSIIDPERGQLKEKLDAMFKLKDKDGKVVEKPEFRDPVTGEVFHFATNIRRLPFFIAKVYSGNMANEEILDIFEGLLLPYSKDIDLTKEDQRLYVRERFLDSAQKIFRMQYDHVKRYEATYGTLADDLPFGCFMESLGAGQSEFITRNHFGQDFSQLVSTAGERKSQSDGKKMTLAEILQKYGKITKEELDDAIKLCPDYYQRLNADQNNRFNDVTDFDERTNIGMGHMGRSEAEKRLYHTDHNTIKGPKLSFVQSRNIWKKALKYADDKNLTGSDEFLLFQKSKLDLFTPAERRALKQQRKKDADTVRLHETHLDAQSEILLNQTVQKLGLSNAGKEVLDELKRLIAFHPGLLDSKTGKTDNYYGLVRKYLGLDITDEKEKAKARRDAFEGFLKLWDNTFLYGALSDDQEDMMTGGLNGYGKEKARKKPDKVMEHSKLFYAEVRHRMFETVKVMASHPGNLEALSDKVRDNFELSIKQQLSQELYRKFLMNSFYLNLKDIGSKRRSYAERMYAEAVKYAKDLLSFSTKLEDFKDEPGFRNSLEYFGVNFDGVLKLTRMKAAEPEKLIVDGVEVDGALFEGELNTDGLVFDDEEVKEEKKEVKQEKEEKEKKEEKKEEQPAVKVEKKGSLDLDEEIAAQLQHPHFDMPPVEYKANVTAPENGEHTEYESQGLGTSYCWACVMSGLMNAYAGKKVSGLDDIKNRPLAIPGFRESGVKDRKTYDDGVKLVSDMYSGNEYGNPAIFGDYIQQKLPDAAVRSAIIAREEGRLPYCRRRFLETLSKSLEKGPVGMLAGGHFVLIRELRGDTLMVNDSMKALPDTAVPYDSTVSDLFAYSGQQIELVWLEKMTGNEQEIADRFDLKYDAGKRTFSLGDNLGKEANAPGQVTYEQVKNEQTILHKNGIEASAQLYDDVVFNFVYLPRQLQQAPGQQVIEQQIQEHPVQEELHTIKQISDVINKEEPVKEEAPLKDEKQEEKETEKFGDDILEDNILDDEHRIDFDTDIEDIPEMPETMEPADLIKDMDGLDFKELKIDKGVNFETIEEMQERLRLEKELETAEEVNKRLDAMKRGEANGIGISGGLKMQALKEKAKKGSFSKAFEREAAPFIERIEKAGYGSSEDTTFYEAMGIESPVELLYAGTWLLSDYVKKRYNYSGKDVNILKKYAALIAAKMEVPLTFMRPKVKDGELKYVPENLAFSLITSDKNEIRQSRQFRKEGIETELVLRGGAHPVIAEKAGRAYRKMYKADTHDFEDIEDIADGIRAAKAGSNLLYKEFLSDFNKYFQAVERFAYEKVKYGDYTRLRAFLNSAIDYAESYLRGKKLKEDRHKVVFDAIPVMKVHRKIIDNAMEKGILAGGEKSATFREVFRSGRDLL